MIQESENVSGKLKIFFGMCAGVGKTYTMLQEAHKLLEEHLHVVIGVVNTHGRVETEKLLQGLPVIPEKWIKYRNIILQELDIEAILHEKPDLVLVDELAHTNAPGSRHAKRWQDVMELLDAGINVYTTLNVQHLESRKELVEEITGIDVRETVPDLVIERASEIELIDIPPSQLLERLREGKIYTADLTQTAIQNFFKEDNLTALREIALRFTAEKVKHDLNSLWAKSHGMRGWKREKLMVGILPDLLSQELIHAGRQRAFELDASWIVVYVDLGTTLSNEEQEHLHRNFGLAKDLGAEVLITHDMEVGVGLLRVAKEKDITKILLGRGRIHKGLKNPFRKSISQYLEEQLPYVDLLIVKTKKGESSSSKKPIKAIYGDLASFSSYIITLLVITGVTFLGWLLVPFIGYLSIGYLFLLSILALSYFVGFIPIFFAALLSTISWDVFFVLSSSSSHVYSWSEIILMVIHFCTCMAIGFFATYLRRQRILLREREKRRSYLYELEKEIANVSNYDELKWMVINKLQSFFSGQFEIFLASEDHLIFDSSLSIIKDEKEQATANWVLLHGKEGGWSTDTLPTSKALYLPITFSHKKLGVLLFHPNNRSSELSIEEKTLLQTIVIRLEIYLDRFLTQEGKYTQEYATALEKVHNAVLHSVSRTAFLPFEKIFALEKSLKKVTLDKEIEGLFKDNIAAMKYVGRMIENMITMSELDSGYITFHKEQHNIRSFLEDCLKEIQPWIEDHEVHLDLPQEMPSPSFDNHLMKLALKNVIFNAIDNSPPATSVVIRFFLEEEGYYFVVLDEGPGISEEFVPLIFKKFYHFPDSPGVGLGLAIVQSIVTIHNGKIVVQKRKEGGTEFTLFFPLEFH